VYNVKKTILALACLIPAVTFAANAEKAYQSADADLKASLKELSELREQIKMEKIPMAKSLRNVQDELSGMRREVDRIQRLRDNATVDLNRLKDNVKARHDQIDYMSNLVAEYGRSLRVRLNITEQGEYDNQFKQFDAAGNSAESTKAERLNKQLPMVQTGIDRINALVGGESFSGKAFSPEGVLKKGKFILVGPTAVFASEDGETIGLALDAGASNASVVNIGEEYDDVVAKLAKTGKGLVPLDPTLGDALAIKREETTVIEHIEAGGIWVFPILLFAGLAALTAIFKIFEIYSVKMPKPGSLHGVLKLLNENKVEEAIAYAKNIPGPAGAMLQDAVAHANESKELIEEVMYERMIEVQPKLERLLPFISVTAATAPLMGLLGTVTGMINTFKLITIFGTGDAKSLSGGISEALITTEFGLIVAIPSLIMHALLSRRAQGVMANMERIAVSFVNGINTKRSS